jgi:glycolate oxidase
MRLRMNYGKVDDRIIDQLVAIVGQKGVVTQREKMIDYSHDEFSQESIRHFPDVVVKPESTAQVSSIMKIANENLIPVTTRGGGTGLCGGCVPTLGGIVLSTERMNKVIEIDKDNLMAVVEPGLSLADFYKASWG